MTALVFENARVLTVAVRSQRAVPHASSELQSIKVLLASA